MDINYEKLQKSISEYGQYILNCIKNEYGLSLTQQQLQNLENLLNSSFIVIEKPTREDIEFFSRQAGITNPEKFSLEYIPSAHGGRTKADNKIHIYPYTKSFQSCKTDEEIIKSCIDDIVVHEIFHYFIRPNLSDVNDLIKEEFGHFITEGLVQYYAEEFAKNHRLGNPKSNYGKNVEFVKKLISEFPDNLTQQQIDRIIFTYNQDELLNVSKNGAFLYQEYVSDFKFNEDLSAFLTSMGKDLGMASDSKELQGIINHYQKLGNSDELFQELSKAIETAFKNNSQARDNYIQKLNGIVSSQKIDLFDKSKFRDDMKLTLETILKEHPHPNITQEYIDNIISNYENSEMKTYATSFYYLQQEIAKIGDSHTTVTLPPDLVNMSRLRFKMIDGKFVVSNSYGKDELLGLSLESINGVDISKIADELSKTIPGRTKEGQAQEIALDLSNKTLLTMLPSYTQTVDDEFNDTVRYSFEGQKVYIEQLQEKNLDVIEDYEHPKDKYKVEFEDGIAKITIKECGQNKEEFNQILETIKNSKSESYIVDLRGNKGGNKSTIQPLLDYLQVEKQNSHDIYTLVDGEVFSSGILTAYDLKNIGSTIIGTELAEKGNHFGQPKEAPVSKYFDCMISKKYFAHRINSEGKIEEYPERVESQEQYNSLVASQESQKFLEPNYLTPDIQMKENKEDIVDKKDSVMEFAVKDLKEKKKVQDDSFKRKFKEVENIEQQKTQVSPRQEQINGLKEFKDQVELAKLQAAQQQIVNSVESVSESQGKSL